MMFPSVIIRLTPSLIDGSLSHVSIVGLCGAILEVHVTAA